MTDWTEAELSALRRAYASGTTRVSYDGKSVDYGSAEDLLARIRTIERAIASLELSDQDVAPRIDWAEAQRRQEAVDREAARRNTRN